MHELNMSFEQKKLFDALTKLGIKRHDEDLPLYKYVSIATAIKILDSSTIKFSTPEELNDKDLEIDLLNPNANEKHKKENTNAMLIKKLKEIKNPHLQTLYNDPKLIADFSENLPLGDYNSLLLQGYEEQRKHVGLFCTTANFSNKKMWSQYADNAKGICIQFNFPTLFNKYFYTFKVNYDVLFKKQDLLDINGNQNETSIYRWLFTKRINYSYEEEVRLFSNTLKGIIHIDKDLISGIYYGENTSNRSKKRIEQILVEKEYSFFKGQCIIL